MKAGSENSDYEMPDMNGFDIDELRNWYRPTHRVLFITGAGISVDSGLPTYRGVAGLYDSANTLFRSGHR